MLNYWQRYLRIVVFTHGVLCSNIGHLAMGNRNESESDDSSDGVEDDCVVDVVVQQVDA